jgi:hypothetical protein
MASPRQSLHVALLALSAISAAAFSAAVGASDVANLPVSAIVRPSTVLRFEGGSVELHVSTVDVARGYVDVPTHAQITVLSGRDIRRVVNVTVDFEPHPDILKSIQVTARPNGNGSGHGSDSSYASSTSLAYRLFLVGNARTRNFSVPLTLSIQL